MDNRVWSVKLFLLEYGPAALGCRIVRQAYQSPDPGKVLQLGIRNASRDVRLAAIDCIAAERPSPSIHAPLLAGAIQDRDDRVRAAVAQAFGRHPSIGAGRRLVILLADPHPRVRENAALALGCIAAEELGPALEGALRDREDSVRSAAAYSLGRIGCAAAISSLAAMARHEPVLEARLQAVGAIVAIAKRVPAAQRKQERAQDLLLEMLLGGYRSWEERVQFQAALIQVGGPSMLARLEQAYTDSNDSDLHVLIVNTFVSLGPCPQVQNDLIRAIRHPSPRVREQAILGLGKVGDKGAIFYLSSLIDEAEKGASLFDSHDASLAGQAIKDITRRSQRDPRQERPDQR